MKQHITLLTSLVLAAQVSGAWAAEAEKPAKDAKADCKTTAECNEKLAKTGAAPAAAPKKLAANITSAFDQAEDQFYWVNKINKASAVMLVEEKIVSKAVGATFAGGIMHAIAQSEAADGKRPTDVLQIEKIMSDKVGQDVTLIHAGRSRQDMYATFRAARLRNQVLDFSDSINSLRERLLAAAEKGVDVIIPAYTNGVQAQPISYAHYLLAYEASLGRDAERIRDFYKRANRSAMGTAVLANSAWPLNRERLAKLLGFDGIIENSLDAGQVSPSDINMEAASIAASTAIRVGAVLGDIHTQYHQTRPWLLLDEGSTYSSSAMPQKRNPGLIMRARETATDVVALGQGVTLRAHNVTTGMTDYKEASAQLGVFPKAVAMISATNAVFDALSVNAKRSQEELDSDWSTSIELPEALQKDHGIPFRVGHGFASDIVSYARSNGLTPAAFPYDKAVEIYAATASKMGLTSTALPLKEKHFRELLSATHMVKSRTGTGGPQPQEVARMLKGAKQALGADMQWLQTTRKRLADADQLLDREFQKLEK